MTPKRVIFLLVAAVTSTAPMHPICRRFADDQGVPTFPAQYICSDDHSQGLDEFCLSTLEWHTHGGLWSSAHGAGSIINDAEQGPSALADHHGSLLHDTVPTCWVCDVTARSLKGQPLSANCKGQPVSFNWFDCGGNNSVFCGSITGPDCPCKVSADVALDGAPVGEAKTRTEEWLGGVATGISAPAATNAAGRSPVHTPRHKQDMVGHTDRNLTTKTAASFLDLAQERFVDRWEREATREDEQWAFNRLQLLRVPKAGSSQASLVARRLGGCTPRGPCCRYPGNPPGSCPAEGLTCHTVAGCTSHSVGGKKRRLLKDPSVFSMSNLRDVVDRLVSGFFYAAPHSPPCAHLDNVDYETCFLEMVHTPLFQNVASKMFSGSSAYDGDVRLCVHEGPDCDATLALVVRGACNLNFVTMCEAPNVSMLLLFEILPWLGPSPDLFPSFTSGPSHLTSKTPPLASQESLEALRHNTGKKHAEGMEHITSQLRKQARHANAVDVSLHQFVSAKFCELLQELDLTEHPLVLKELSTYNKLGKRCRSSSWIADTLDRFKPITPDDCRLYQPFAGPTNN